MLKFVSFVGIASTLVIVGCSEAPNQDAVETADTAEAASADDAASAPPSGSTGLPELTALEVTIPKLAYVYDYAFRTDGQALGNLQRRHADLCEQQGSTSCRILGMTKSGEDAEEMTGELQLAVASTHARAFGALIEKEAEAADAQQIAAEISTEDVSRAMIDTEAQLRARTELRDRLVQILRTRTGSVEELVAAERNVAQVNQEIDKARSWLREMQGRVAYSRVNIRYESGAPVANDFLAPIQAAAGSLGSILGFVIGALIVLGAVLVPLGALVWLARWFRTKLPVAPIA
jgi:hypothetical protein